MDLIGEFHPPTSRGQRYALTAMDMLIGFVFCAPLQTKKAEEVVQKYLDTVYYRFGGSQSWNGMKLSPWQQQHTTFSHIQPARRDHSS